MKYLFYCFILFFICISSLTSKTNNFIISADDVPKDSIVFEYKSIDKNNSWKNFSNNKDNNFIASINDDFLEIKILVFGNSFYQTIIVNKKDKNIECNFLYNNNNPSFIIANLETNKYLSFIDKLESDKQIFNDSVFKHFSNKDSVINIINNRLLSLNKIYTYEKNINSKKLILINYIDACNYAFMNNSISGVDKNMLCDIIKTVPPNSYLWESKVLPGSLIIAKEITGNNKFDDYIKQLLLSINDMAVIRSMIKDLFTYYYNADVEEFNKYFYFVSNKMKQNKKYTKIADELTLPYTMIGTAIPEFSIQSLDDKTQNINIKDLNKNWILIDFWASGCSPCIKGLKQLNSISKIFINHNLQFLCISIDKKYEDAKNILLKQNNNIIYGIDTKGFEGIIKTLFKRSSIPYKLLVNPEGIIVEAGEALDDLNLEITLKKYLK